MVKQLHPNARDAAQKRVNRITVGVIAASIAATLGIGAGIAVAAPPPKTNNKTDYGKKTKNKPATSPTKGVPPQQQQAPKQQPDQAPPPADDKPESSSGDEETTSGGS